MPITDKSKLAYTLQSQVRIDKAKEEMMFDAIHVWEHRGFSDDDIVWALGQRNHCETEAEAWHWLRRYKEKQQRESEEAYLEEQARLSGEIDEINKTLARLENRIEEQE